MNKVQDQFEEVMEAAEAAWQDDLAKFFSRMKKAPFECKRMFELGAEWERKKKERKSYD